MAKRLRPGDVLEVRLPEGLGYLLCVGTHPEYGDAITVSPAVVSQRPSVTVDLFEEGYVTFYPARAALSQGLVMVVGRLPARALPRRIGTYRNV